MKVNINTLLRNNPRNSSRGAPLGDMGFIDDAQPKSGLLCQRVDLVDGAYGPDGTYWGAGTKSGNIYAVFNGRNAEFNPTRSLLQYFRAHTRKDAIAQFNEDFPGFTFARN